LLGIELRMNEFCTPPTCPRQRFEIFNIRCNDFVAVVGNEDNRSIDQIRLLHCPEEHAGSPTQILVDRLNIHTCQGL
jgi:hypothetical protein